MQTKLCVWKKLKLDIIDFLSLKLTIDIILRYILRYYDIFILINEENILFCTILRAYDD